MDVALSCTHNVGKPQCTHCVYDNSWRFDSSLVRSFAWCWFPGVLAIWSSLVLRKCHDVVLCNNGAEWVPCWCCLWNIGTEEVPLLWWLPVVSSAMLMVSLCLWNIGTEEVPLLWWLPVLSKCHADVVFGILVLRKCCCCDDCQCWVSAMLMLSERYWGSAVVVMITSAE